MVIHSQQDSQYVTHTAVEKVLVVMCSCTSECLSSGIKHDFITMEESGRRAGAICLCQLQRTSRILCTPKDPDAEFRKSSREVVPRLFLAC